MPRSVVVSLGISWGPPGTRTCGFLWGPPEASGGSRSRPSKDFRLLLAGQNRFAARPEWLSGLPYSADLEGA